MGFFDNLGKKANEAYKVTADKTGKLAKEAKLRVKMGELKSQINAVYQEIGKAIYENHIKEEKENIEEVLNEKCTKIDELSNEIKEMEKQCLELRDKKQCSKCFKEMDKQTNFCPNCGEKQEEIPAKEVEVVTEEVKEEVKAEEEKQEENENKEDAE